MPKAKPITWPEVVRRFEEQIRKEDAMQGTEWTEPGEGATVRDFRIKIAESVQFSHHYTPDGQPIAMKALLRLIGEVGKKAGEFTVTDGEYATNLRLTGAPLTAEDLKRISECK